jgi:3-polyprenyl-4-hydroxybenzoate decarboxylase
MIMYSVLQVLLGLPLCSFNFKHVVLLLMPLHAAQEQNMSKQKYTSQGSVVVPMMLTYCRNPQSFALMRPA